MGRRLGRARKAEHSDLGGTWYAIWETTVDGRKNINREVLAARSHRSRLSLWNLSPSLENQLAGYLWRGRLMLRHHLAIGYYEAIEPQMRYAGSLYYIVHSSGAFMTGRWVGLNFDSELATGLTVLARSPGVAEDQFVQLREETGDPIDQQPRARLFIDEK